MTTSAIFMQYFTQLFSSTSFDVLDQLKKEIMQTMNKITETYILFLRRIRDAVLNVIFFVIYDFLCGIKFGGKNLLKFKRTTEIIHLFLVIVNYINNRPLIHVFYAFIARTLMIFFVSLSVQMK